MKCKVVTGIICMLFFASILVLSFNIRLVAPDPATIVMVDYGLTSSSGAYRWMDVANQEYSSDYRNNYNYSQSSVTITYADVGETLNGTLIAENLKPNFAYQLKLVGTPGTVENEHIGLVGRWWQETWNGSAWTDGMNLNNKSNGASPNPNDETYFARRFVADNSSPTGYHYQYTGYLVFDYFMTDSNGSAALSFQTGSCYHVLWKTSQRFRTASDGPLKTVTFDPDPSQTAYDQNYSNSTISIFGEWERLPMGDTNLAIGQYTCQIVLTEESFHGIEPLEGNWATAMTAAITFTINATETYYYSFSRFLSHVTTGRGNNTYIRNVTLIPLICSFNMTLTAGLYGEININIPKDSFYFEPIYYQDVNITWTTELISDGYGKIYTLSNGDVDIISMTNDTGTFFWYNNTWHTAAEQWIGDGNATGQEGSSWLRIPANIVIYPGEDTGAPSIGNHTLDMWFTTGYIENTVSQTGSLLDVHSVNGRGAPFDGIGGPVTWVSAGARTNVTYIQSFPDNTTKNIYEDKQWLTDLGGCAIPAGSGSLFSPANLNIEDPLTRVTGTLPNGTIMRQVSGAFYTGPNSEPERIIIPNPLNGTYEILITGTGNGTYGFMVDFAFSMNLSERTKDVYYSTIVEGGVLWTKVIVSGKDVKSYTPVSTVGDINQDALVDIVDIVNCALAYGSETQDNPETPWDETENWNPLVDLNLDQIIDIVDLVKIAIHFGETW